MPCRILRALYLRANGEIPCDDDFGEQMVLGWVPKNDKFSISKIFFNEKYRHISDSFAKGVMPWGRICDNCAFHRPSDPPDNHLEKRVISYFQIEPTLLCALKCPGCSRVDQLSSRPGPSVLDLSVLHALLNSLKREGYVVHNIDYCGQGEPLNHPDIGSIISSVREAYPQAKQRMITNGNHSYRKKLEENFVEEIMVSVDGATQRSYEKYRIGGSFYKSIDFMYDAKKYNPDHKVIWKYVLFEYNDSPDEIRLAEDIAEDIGIDALQFVRTHSAGRSVKWEKNKLPIKWSNSIDTSTPHLER